MTWPLGDRPFLVSESVSVIFVEPEVFYSVPDDMKSMNLQIWGRLWGLPLQRTTLIKEECDLGNTQVQTMVLTQCQRVAG